MTHYASLPSFMPKAGSRVAIAGGCGALGKHLTQAAVDCGLETIVLDRQSSIDDQELPKGVDVIAMDVGNSASVDAAFSEIARTKEFLDHLYFLIGFSPMPPKLLADVDDDSWDAVINANLRAAHIVARAARPLLLNRPGASITFISSALTYGPQKNYGSYIAAKSGLNGLTRALALENAPSIRVNAIAPSAMLTPFMIGGTGLGKSDSKPEDMFDAKAAGAVVPMGRLCEPADVIGPLLFIASEAAGFVTGQILHVNGGRLMP
ncbi:MAG: SDR family oxidoreductase [Alphaproteobacteria bacterium]|nr:SDR family oxidoreductase [Alphaproteobacteria bacterium]